MGEEGYGWGVRQGGDFREQSEMEEDDEEDEDEDVEAVLSCRLSLHRLFLQGQTCRLKPHKERRVYMDLFSGGSLLSDLWFGVLWILWLGLLLGRELSTDLILFICLQDWPMPSCSTVIWGNLRADLICQRKKSQDRERILSLETSQIVVYCLMEFGKNLIL